MTIDILRRRNTPATQLERYHVERYKAVGTRKWAWVTVGHYMAGSHEEARRRGRGALADTICVLRATPIGQVR